MGESDAKNYAAPFYILEISEYILSMIWLMKIKQISNVMV